MPSAGLTPSHARPIVAVILSTMMTGCIYYEDWVVGDTRELPGPDLVGIMADVDEPTVRRTAALDELAERIDYFGGLSENYGDALRSFDATGRAMLGHQQCSVRLDGWLLVRHMLDALSEEWFHERFEHARSTVAEALRTVAGNAAASIDGLSRCGEEHASARETARFREFDYLRSFGCDADYRVWHDELSISGTRDCLQLEVAYVLQRIADELGGFDAVPPLIEIIEQARTDVVRGRVISLLGAFVPDRIEVRRTAERLLGLGGPVAQRASEVLDPLVRLSGAVPLHLGRAARGEIKRPGAWAPGIHDGNPIYSLTLERETMVMLDIDVGDQADHFVDKWILHENGDVVKSVFSPMTLGPGTHYIYTWGRSSTGPFQIVALLAADQTPD